MQTTEPPALLGLSIPTLHVILFSLCCLLLGVDLHLVTVCIGMHLSSLMCVTSQAQALQQLAEVLHAPGTTK